MDWTPIIAIGTMAGVCITAFRMTSKQIGTRIDDLKADLINVENRLKTDLTDTENRLKTDLTNTENRLNKQFDRLEDKLTSISENVYELGRETARAEGNRESRGDLKNLLELVKK